MEDKENINYDNYQIVFNGQLMGFGAFHHGDIKQFWTVVIKFASVEIVEKRRDWAELEKYFDFNLTISQNPYEFLSNIFNLYYPFYSNNDEYNWYFSSFKTGIQLQIVRKFMGWFAVQMEEPTVKNYLHSPMGDELRENYAKIRSQSTPTPSPSEKDKDKIFDFVKDINPCIEFDNLFGTDLKGKIEIWNYMIDLKMIDANGAFLMGKRRDFIFAFIKIMKKYFKIPNQSNTSLIEIFTLKLLGKKRRINDYKVIDEQQIEAFFNGKEN